MEPGALRSLIREVPDFPRPGVGFKDITPLLGDPIGFGSAVEGLVGPYRELDIDLVVGIEARGFVFSAPVAHSLGAGLVPIRKPGKLPGETQAVVYDLEYGDGVLEIHRDAIAPGSRCLIVDDVLATGGTAAAGRTLVEGLGGEVVGLAFVVELGFLGGRARLGDTTPIQSLIHYES